MSINNLQEETNRVNDNCKYYDYLIVGSGLSGAVLAERIASTMNKKVLVIDKRDHIGGNCYDFIDENNILMNKYGAHIFHTNYENVWDYVNKFSKWVRWDHKVLSYVDKKYVPVPVNINTVNILCNENLKNENEMTEWLDNNQVKYIEITNSEQMGKSRVGCMLYDKLIKEYTFKQWNKYPEELDKSVLERIPIRPNFDTRYFNDKYQALPRKGYTHFFERILDNKNIEVKLNTDYFEHIKNNKYDVIIFTGPIDSYFTHLEKLEYRS
jgi:UDP-galactopyranose mutase